MPAQAEDAATPPVEAGRVAPPREPRRVPVLTASKPEEEITPEQTPARVVPVLSPEVSGADSAAGTVERARVAEPSLR
jgi:hypothetical protein